MHPRARVHKRTILQAVPWGRGQPNRKDERYIRRRDAYLTDGMDHANSTYEHNASAARSVWQRSVDMDNRCRLRESWTVRERWHTTGPRERVEEQKSIIASTVFAVSHIQTCHTHSNYVVHARVCGVGTNNPLTTQSRTPVSTIGMLTCTCHGLVMNKRQCC